MAGRVATALFLGPALSRAFLMGKPAWFATSVKAHLDNGITVLLSVVEPSFIRDACIRHEALCSERAVWRANLRLVSPGRFLWPDGSLKLPSDEQFDREAIHVALTKLPPIIAEAGTDTSVEASPDGDFLALSGKDPVDPEWAKAVWKRCNEPDTVLSSDPSALEAFRTEAGRWSTVLAPDVPSVSWAAVVSAERITPGRLVVCSAASGDAAQSIRAFLASLREADDGDEVIEIQVDLGGTYIPIPADCMLAARINAPSEIHFVHRWTGSNQRYVGKHFWRATKRARTNVERGRHLLGDLDEATHSRVRDVLSLATNAGGHRLVDDYSGAICFDPGDYEFELRRPLTARPVDAVRSLILGYFDEKIEDMPFDRPLLRRRMFTDSQVLLRGEAYYTNLKELPPWKRAREYADEAQAMLKLLRALDATGSFGTALEQCMTGGEETRDGWKLLLGALDQARNLGLVMLSIAAHRWGDRGHDADDPNLLQRADFLVSTYYRALLGNLRAKDAPSLVNNMCDALIKGQFEMRELADVEEARAKGADWYEPGRPIRGWREADDPYENLLMCLLAVDGIPRGADNGVACLGMFWGGVELPVVAKVAAEVSGHGLGAYGFIRHGRYSSASSSHDRHFCDLSTGHWRRIEELAGDGVNRALVMDDNSLTGQTLEAARDMLLLAGVPEVETWVVRFSGERREGQIRMPNGGIVHPAYFEAGLQGYLAETPYARSYSRKRYESPIGVFNTARARILRYLHSNGFGSMFEREGF